MPTISQFFGITIQMYWGDHNPPHIHVIYGGAEALLAIDDSRLLAGGLPRGTLRVVRAWMERHRDELFANWQNAETFEPLTRIPGADQE